jgi:SAM-dependent methyltransferase
MRCALQLDRKPIGITGKEETTFSVKKAFCLKHGDPASLGPAPRMRWRLGYFTPDDFYEGLIAQLVGDGMAWLDVGGGRDVFPQNPRLAETLARRCRLVVGVDPSDNIEENCIVHQRVKTSIEEYQSDQTFDLATLRMVAEHLTQPTAAVAALARLVRPGGKVVVYTVNLWSPVALVAWLVPFHLHHALKNVLWRTSEKDSFPVAYQMNTRRQLEQRFSQGGFRECAFAYLDDCRIFHRFRFLSLMEVGSWKALRAVGLRYPENCLLGVYERC